MIPTPAPAMFLCTFTMVRPVFLWAWATCSSWWPVPLLPVTAGEYRRMRPRTGGSSPPGRIVANAGELFRKRFTRQAWATVTVTQAFCKRLVSVARSAPPRRIFGCACRAAGGEGTCWTRCANNLNDKCVVKSGPIERFHPKPVGNVTIFGNRLIGLKK